MAERLNALVLKTGEPQGFGGSNPSPSANYKNCKTVKLTNSPSQIKFASRVSLPVCEFDSLRENEAMTNGEFKVELENVPSAFLSQFCEHFVSFPSVLNLAI